MLVLVGSKNPVKVQAVEEIFSRFFPETKVLSFSVPSGVPDQPSCGQVLGGCRNRALELKKINDEQNLGADFFVGMEGGITEMPPRWFNFNGTCILDRNGREGYGTSPLFELPESVTRQLLDGKELGDVMDHMFKDHKSKQKGGAIGHFTKGEVKRKKLCKDSLIMALVPFLNRDIFFRDE